MRTVGEKDEEQIKFEIFKRKHEDLILSMEMFMEGMAEMSQSAKEKDYYKNIENVVRALRKLRFPSYEEVIINYSIYRAKNWIEVGICMTKYYEDICKIKSIELPVHLKYKFDKYLDESVPNFFINYQNK